MENMNTISQKIEELKTKGYTVDFIFKNDKLSNGQHVYNAEDVTIEEEYRFEGKANPDDLSILYQITAAGDVKGTIVDGYGPTANADLAAFLLKADS